MFQLCRQCFSLENQEQRTQKSNVSTLQTMFQSGQTRPESTEREKQAEREREASKERDKQRGELTERGSTDKE